MTLSSGNDSGLRWALKKCTKMKMTPIASSASFEWITRAMLRMMPGAYLVVSIGNHIMKPVRPMITVPTTSDVKSNFSQYV